jgi:hypothetical protein
MLRRLKRAPRALLVCIAAAACGDLDAGSDARAPAATQRDFSVSVTSGPETLPQGSSATYTIETAAATRESQPLTLSVTGLPAGVTAVLAPSTVNAGETAVLELNAAPTAAPVEATFTVTAVALKGAARKAAGQLSIVAASP